MSANLELGFANTVGHGVGYSGLSGKHVNRLLQFSVLSALMHTDIQGTVGGRAPHPARRRWP